MHYLSLYKVPILTLNQHKPFLCECVKQVFLPGTKRENTQLNKYYIPLVKRLANTQENNDSNIVNNFMRNLNGKVY